MMITGMKHAIQIVISTVQTTYSGHAKFSITGL